jgi:hypothetical protein
MERLDVNEDAIAQAFILKPKEAAPRSRPNIEKPQRSSGSCNNHKKNEEKTKRDNEASTLTE